jgi:cytochrome c oxidase cbb3-type subunit II
MAGKLHHKTHTSPIFFAILATAVILVGTIVTMFYPMLTPEMHPKLENLKPYTALQLAGRDIYQRESCMHCHTQTVRPLKAEVLRYGEYSKAGEFAYDHPFLWGSKRTGPDLARVGGKYPDMWHYKHFENPRAFFPESNMPAYGWLKDNRLDPSDVEAHMKALDFPYSPADISDLKDKTELDALVAYIQVLGTAIKKQIEPVAQAAVKKSHVPNPLAGNPKAIEDGRALFKTNCASCHGEDAKGVIGPSLVADEFLYVKGDVPDDDYFDIISDGTQPGMVKDGRTAKGGMPPFAQQLDKSKIWSLVAYIRSLQGK